jgi:hypothetical protein
MMQGLALSTGEVILMVLIIVNIFMSTRKK